MKTTTSKFRQPWIGKCILSLIVMVWSAGISFAQQFDAAYYDLQNKNKDR